MVVSTASFENHLAILLPWRIQGYTNHTTSGGSIDDKDKISGKLVDGNGQNDPVIGRNHTILLDECEIHAILRG